ncbi:hypothetical protein Tsp_01795 [Trichinella spiralis]|uniref:hypothetical protein n=1 Tax=Trichinella spiralis TaxID=6334 RepID=UPI0001EFCE85|nr:hypothetical protein Tsp_01795 [Trichinella spiralis]
MEKKTLLKKRSAEETKPIPAIYDEEASAESAEPFTSGYFPLFKRVKSTMYSHRAKRYPKLPNHRRDLQILVPFRTTKAGEDFLLWQCASRHILVFATGYNIRLLAAMRTWSMDSTFKVVPQWYQQLFTIHAFVAGKLVPAVYCDVRGSFPNTRVQGCCFHFCQAVHRKVGEMGLKTPYRTEEGTRKIRMLLSTAFLPVPQVDTGVSLLEAGTTATLAALFQYFRQEWMTDERLPLWNVHNVNIRTNNDLEDPDSRIGCDGHPDSTSAIRKRYRLQLKTGKQGLC